ncbi:MAG TPA: hypothetical protein VGV59_07860 [Pyrinomonadaceae bacterium]|nr:hypothetical protein [Pyrinomonadaceae bacterium]
MTETDNMSSSNAQDANDEAVDSQGMDTTGGLALLRRLRDNGFEGDNERYAVALGRPIEEVEAWMNGQEPPDDDIIMKARGIAKERGIEIE